MAESKESYQIRADDVQGLLQSLNFHMARVADRLDALEGHRDRPRFYSNPQLKESTAYRQIRTDSDQILESQGRVSAPTSLSESSDVTGSDSVDIDALNALINSIALRVNQSFTTMQNAQLVSGSASDDPPSEFDVTFQGEGVTVDGEETTW